MTSTALATASDLPGRRPAASTGSPAVAALSAGLRPLRALGRASARRAVALARAVAGRARAAGGDDRGDVPGWVLISLMTAGIVMVLWATAGELLVQVFQNAIDRVAAFG